ncbi:hypothetical protein CEXT_155781 [Caerostris extrusa]|uniref:Uncharacterized protein n=1 Tax=Caerostris extrusa TaxID=172846 RepID=A0AAV4T9H3_CAEEX|nr:hypothetical protein CEXT_155781 [Caerostris extrusa]
MELQIQFLQFCSYILIFFSSENQIDCRIEEEIASSSELKLNIRPTVAVPVFHFLYFPQAIFPPTPAEQKMTGNASFFSIAGGKGDLHSRVLGKAFYHLLLMGDLRHFREFRHV